MKKVITLLCTFFLFLSFASPVEAAKKKVKLSFDETTVQRVDKYSFKVSGKVDKKATVTFNKKKIKLKTDKDGKFNQVIKLKKKVKKKVKVVAKRKGYKKKKIKLKVSDTELKKKEADADKKKEEDQKNKSKEEQEKINTINNEAAEHLKLNQGWAYGTIDENGNPTDNGEPNPEYTPWLFVHSIKYDGSNIDVKVTADFLELYDSEKDSLASSIQGVVMSYGSLDERPHLYVYNGENSYGGSKILSSNEFKWY